MHNSTVLPFGSLIAAILLAVMPARADGDRSSPPLSVSRVAGDVWLVSGTGGNVAALVGAEGTALIDSQFAPLAPKILAALVDGGAPASPVRFVVSTHWHWDHTDGNPFFSGRGAAVVAQDSVRRRLADSSGFGNRASVRYAGKPPTPGVLPVLTFGHDATLFLNGEEVHAVHFPSAHTDGDVVVFFRRANVVHTGDIFVRYGFPFIDLETGGSIDGMIDACRRLLAMIPADARIVPGHGDVASTSDLREYLAMLEQTREAVTSGIAAGKSLETLKRDRVLDRWNARYSGDFISTDAFVETLFHSVQSSQPQQP